MLCFTFALCLTFLPTAANGAGGADQERAKRVLMLFSENKFLPGNALVEQAAKKVLEQSGHPLEFYAEYLDTSRFSSRNHYQLFREYLQEKYGPQPPDLILAFLTTQFELAGQLPAELFPKAPVVFGALTEDKIPRERLGANATGIAVRMDVKGALATIMKLQPETKTIVVIGGTAPLDKLFLSKTEEAARSLSGRIQFDFWVTHPLVELRRMVAALPPRTVILFTNMFRDAAGETFVPEAAASLVAVSANVPVYVLIETKVGGGAVGGKVVHFEAAGQRVGELARRVLDGAAPASIPIEVREEGAPIFDWRALKRWGISESRLPPGSIIRFREPSIWDQYKWYIIGAFALIAIQTVMIAGLLLQRARRRRAEGELRESEEKFSLAAESANLGVWYWDISNDSIWATEMCRDLYGFRPEQEINFQTFVETLHEGDRERIAQAVERALHGRKNFAEEYRVVLPGGAIRWIGAFGRGSYDSAGKTVRMLGVSIDITERKRGESELQRNREELAHVTRISTMGELAASLAHELNQPLTAILSNAQAAQRFLSANPVDMEEVREILKDIVDDNSRAGDVIRQMRALVKKEDLAFVSLDVADVIRDVMQLLHSDAILRNVRVSLECSSKLPSVCGDKVQLQQVVLNLLLNAFDAMKDTPAAEREVVVRTEMNGFSTVEVAVQDHGAGLTSDKLDKIFEPFFTTKREGLGMGLSISRSIIEAHGGRLWAENNDGRGATFYFTVPAMGGESSPATSAQI